MRVMVARMPRMLRDIVENTISKESDMQLLPIRSVRRRPRIERDDPDVIVVATRRMEGSQDGERWLADWPHARILVIETSGRRSMMYELRPHVTPLGALSPLQLVDAIRSVRPSRGSD